MYLDKTVAWSYDYLHNISTFASILGPTKEVLVTPNSTYKQNKEKVQLAREVGLLLHPWVYRMDQDVLPIFKGDDVIEQV